MRFCSCDAFKEAGSRFAFPFALAFGLAFPFAFALGFAFALAFGLAGTFARFESPLVGAGRAGEAFLEVGNLVGLVLHSSGCFGVRGVDVRIGCAPPFGGRLGGDVSRVRGSRLHAKVT